MEPMHSPSKAHKHNAPLISLSSLDSSKAHSPPPHEDIDGRSTGLKITIEKGGCRFQLCRDKNFRHIHPNGYCPFDMINVRSLGGGGSGVKVFSGHHPNLGDVVMKHGGFKDMVELFALATIREDLKRRGALLGRTESMIDIQRRIPEFKMIYISPFHIMDRDHFLKDLITDVTTDLTPTRLLHPSGSSFISPRSSKKRSKRRSEIKPKNSGPLGVGTRIRLFEGEDDDLRFELDDTNSKQKTLAVILPRDASDFQDPKNIIVRGDAYKILKEVVVDDLVPMMTDRLFKFTLAQKTIGGVSPKTGNRWLYEGKLCGSLLDTLITQFLRVVKHLQALTLPEEVDVVDLIRDEVERIENDEFFRADEISETADTFVGNAIRKNFHPEKGRWRFSREMCERFRNDSGLVLSPEEVLPARHLGTILRSGALMSDTYVDGPTKPTVLQTNKLIWRNLLARAVDSMSPSALQRIWTCGFSDAGIHNMFISEETLYLFDLGEPQLQSVPGFLTKFLFSFFHTLGMQDDEKDKDAWVRRFVPSGDKLALTKETVQILPIAYDAFGTCLDRIVDELFDGDRCTRWLLLQYVTLQLLSDAAFCMQRWEIKGGGRPRDHNHNKGIEKWLWRALWDVYVAFDINTQDSWTRFDIEHPHFNMSPQQT